MKSRVLCPRCDESFLSDRADERIVVGDQYGGFPTPWQFRVNGGIRLENQSGALIERNLYLDNPTSSWSYLLLMEPPTHFDVTFRDNVSFQWSNPQIVVSSAAVNTGVTRNRIDEPASSHLDASRTSPGDAFAAETRLQSREFWRAQYTAEAMLRHLRGGFFAE